MNNDIQTLFQSHFDYSTYSRQIVHDVFGCNDIEQTLDDPIDTSAAGDKSYYIGQMEDSDHQLLGFFYTRTAEGSDVRRKRVGWRKLISPYLKYHVDAAVAVFDDGQHWRLSYICDQKESLTAAKRFSYVMGDAAGQYKTPVARLGRVAACRGRFALRDIFEAFSVEALSNQFFDEYRNYYADIVEDLTGKRMVKAGNNWVEKVIHAPLQSVYEQLDGVEDADKMVRDYVKKLMGRIVFLHFLQKKGWLNGNPAFLSDLFFMQPLDRKADFLEKVLEPLFFGIFNTERAGREKLFAEQGWDMELMEKWRDLPYLNGGLFERDEVDKVHVKLPELRFKKLFEFLASYNFTVDENDPDDAEVGVDPEMLGKIFESLLEDNKSKGAFYTPKEIVRYMCKESLIAYLVSKVGNSGGLQDASERLNARSANNPTQGTQCGDNDSNEKCVSETHDLKAIIRQFVEQHELPAELEPYRETLDAALRNVKICDPAIGSGAFPMGLLNELWRCREALQDTSEGCDFNNTVKKVQWTFDSEAENLAKRSAVTSTERPLHAGGTRPQSRVDLKKEIIENNIYGVDIERGAIDIARLRFWLSIVVDAEEPEPLPNFDYKFMQGNSLIESFVGHDLSHIMDTRPLPGRGARRAGWIENQTGMDFSSDDTRQNLRIWLKKYFSLTDHKEKAHYRELINGSVKSYIKQQGIGPTAEAKLDKLDPSANQDFFLWHTWFKDIFDQGGFDIVIGNPPYVSGRSNGKYCKYETESCYDLYAYFFERAAKLLACNGILSFITSSLYVKGLKYTTLRSFLQDKTSLIAFRIEGDDVFKNAGIPTATLITKRAKGVWRFEDLYMDKSLTEKIRKDTVPLSSVSSIMRGFEIGRNMVGSVGQYKFLTGSDVSKYSYNKLSYISQSVLNAFSKDAKYFSKERILLRETGSFLTAVYLGNETIYSNRSLYSILITDRSLNTKYILALLNSSLLQWYYSNMFKGDTELFPKIRITQAKQLPIRKVCAEQQQPIVALIDKILSQKQLSPNTDTTSLENEIDKLVYQLYSLTPEEISIVEDS